jgi:hypothetical protein
MNRHGARREPKLLAIFVVTLFGFVVGHLTVHLVASWLKVSSIPTETLEDAYEEEISDGSGGPARGIHYALTSNGCVYMNWQV